MIPHLTVVFIVPWLMGASTTAQSAYSRAQWGPWTNHGCLTTREHVLIRDAIRAESGRSTVRLSGDGCAIVAGQWEDPYTGERVTEPGKIDVDHVVAVKWAHAHGGAGWPAERKRAYFNDLAYPHALLAVSATVNREKGDRGPADWRPRPAMHCTFAHWVAAIWVKWGLQPETRERQAVGEMLATCVP